MTTGLTAPTSREQTEALVLRTLHRHGIASAKGFLDRDFDGLPLGAIAEMTHLSRPSVYTVRDAYTVDGNSPVLASDVESLDGKLRGSLRLRADLGYAIGVDFGPRHARVAIADAHGQLEDEHIYARHFPLGQPPELYLDWTASRIRELTKTVDVDLGDIMGVGISQVAPVNLSTGYPHPNGLTNKAWRDVSVAKQLARRLDWDDVSAVSDNDTNLRTLAEYQIGAARALNVGIYVNWSNHVSFGLLIGGRVYRGSQGYAGELGHRLISGGTNRCLRCGRTGCLEATISASGLAAELGAPEEVLPRSADFIFRRIAEEVEVGNTDVFEKVNGATRHLAETAALLVDALDPEAVILAGSLGSQIHDNTGLLGTFRSTLEASQMGFASNIRILEPALGLESAVRGAILRILSERLVPWARRRLERSAAAAAHASTGRRKGRQKQG